MSDRPSRRRRVPALAIVAAVLAVLVFGIGGTGWWISLVVERPFKGWSGDEVFVEIPQGAGASAMARRLADAGVVESPLMFRLAAWQAGA
jgi:cell division protein YceG involved in septum cleavage